jgi:SET domain-containing protein
MNIKLYMDFKERFGVKPPVKYLEKTIIAERYKEAFLEKYSNFFKKYKEKNSKTRIKQLKAFLKKLNKADSDLNWCKRVSLKFINKQVGYGVFAKCEIPPYSTLHEYVGELVPTEKLKESHDCSFSFEYFPEFCIDAMKKGNWTRFMNHCERDDPANNVIVWEFYTKDGPHIIFTTGNKRVKKGAQLLYSYGDEYWENKTFLKLK